MPSLMVTRLFNRLFQLLFFLFFTKTVLQAQSIVNAYANVTNISGNSFTVSNVNETNHTFAIGESVIIIQMQDNVIGTNTNNISSFGDIGNIQSAGLYEAQVITGLTRSAGVLTSLTFSGGVVNAYNINSNSRVQVVTLRKLSAAAFTTTANITGAAWDGTVGGVVALQVGTDLTLAHNITADAIGFRGGGTSTNFSAVPCTAPSNTVYTANDGQQGYKGEGIYRISSTTYTNCRGKLLNGGGGGNNHNAGGGGGGNYEQGGTGGIGWNNCTAFPGGGLGGISLKSVIGSRLFMGGGGGGGQQNDNVGSAGGNGGGIIFIKANKIITSGSCGSALKISANGATPSNSGQDGAGGAGAGGSIYMQVNTYSVVGTCSLNINANGGNGASAIDPATHGGGGAGGQGFILFSGATPTTNVLVSTNNGTAGCNNNSSPCTSSAGSASGSNGGGIQPGNAASCTSNNLLTNPSFEFSVVPSIGNNLTGVFSWGGWTMTGGPFNVIKTDGSAYAGGPNNAQDGTQYIDITSAAGTLYQKFTVPCTTTLNFSGYFSSREASGSYVNWTASVQIVGSSGVVATSNTKSFTNANGNDEIWYQVTGTAVVAAGNYTYNAVLGDFGNFDNAFLCGTSCFVLPIQLLEFKANYSEASNQVNLYWITASEINSDYYLVERSEDGISWKTIKRVTAAGNSTIKKEYYCTDDFKVSKTVYYRLVQTDFDASYTTSNIVAVNPDSGYGEVIIYPNPSNGLLTVKSNQLLSEIIIYDSLGNQIDSVTPTGLETKLSLLNKGVYFVKTISNALVKVKRVLVE